MNNRKNTAHDTGKIGEEIAEAYLKKRGFRILQNNYRTRRGEIDLVCRDNEFLVFVEVKSEEHETGRFIGERVDLRKQKRIILAALDYLANNEIPAGGCRFDVVLLSGISRGEWKIRHIRDAFRLEDSNSTI